MRLMPWSSVGAGFVNFFGQKGIGLSMFAAVMTPDRHASAQAAVGGMLALANEFFFQSSFPVTTIAAGIDLVVALASYYLESLEAQQPEVNAPRL